MDDELIDPQTFAKQLGAVCEVLAPLPWPATYLWLQSPLGSLSGRKPFEALSQGAYKAVSAAAEGYLDGAGQPR